MEKSPQRQRKWYRGIGLRFTVIQSILLIAIVATTLLVLRFAQRAFLELEGANVSQLIQQLGGYLVGIETIGLLLIFLVVHRMYVRPIRKLTHTLSDEQYPEAEGLPTTRGELAQLAETLLKGQQSLRENIATLEHSNRTLRSEIAQRSNTEKDLENSRARLKNLLEHAPEAILLLKPPGFEIFDANISARKLFAHSSRGIRSYNIFEVLGADPDGNTRQEKRLRSCLQDALKGKSNNFEWKGAGLPGKQLEITISEFPTDAEPEIRISFLDVSERNFLETQLRQSQKMEAIGQLAGGIAHDFNNLLVSIMGHNEFLRDAVALTPEATESIEEIKNASHRAAKLTGQLLAYSRKQILNPKSLDLNEVVAQIVSMLERVLGENIRLKVEHYPAPVRVTADQTQMEQVILNLATNARDAMPNGGDLLIQVELLPGTGLTTYSTLRVSDTGDGMSPEIQKSIFEPFFTTKNVGHGTGLGLSSAHGIVKQSGGDIEVTSAPGEGTCITVKLPFRDDAEDAEADRVLAHQGNISFETIMLVEDDGMVAAVMQRSLETAGFNVIMARDGRAALAALADGSLKPELIITDIVMPEMDGIQLAEELLVDHPDLPLLFVTGYTNDHEKVKPLLALGETILRKPFAPSELILQVRARLDSRIEVRTVN